MAQMLFLLIVLSTFLFFAYVISDRDIMSPSVLFVAGFIMAVVAAMMNINDWGINLSIKTIAIIIIGNMSFIVAEIMFKLTHRHSYNGNREVITKINVEKWKNFVVILIGIVTLILYYREIVRLSSYAESYWQNFGVMVAYKRAITYGTVSVNTMVNQLTKLVYAFGYIYAYIFINNFFSTEGKGKIRKNIIYLIPIIIYAIMSVLKGNRIDIMGLVIMLVFLYYVFLHKKVGWEKHISGKLLKKAIIIFVIGMIIFYYMKDLVGRVSSLNLLEYITQYIGGSVELLDLYVKDSVSTVDVPFGETLTGLINGLKKIGLLNVDIRKQLEFRYTPTGVYLGNVYTALRRYYHDGGWIGLIAFPAILSYFMNCFYGKVKKYKGLSINKIFKMIVYASLIYVIPFQAMEDTFWINKVTIGYIVELVILYFCVQFVFVRFKFSQGE